jgi:hypothetical protein
MHDDQYDPGSFRMSVTFDDAASDLVGGASDPASRTFEAFRRFAC